MKTIKILLAVLAYIAVGITANAQLSFSGNIEARQNSYAEVSVVMSNDQPMRGFQFDLTLPDGLEPTIEKVGDTNHSITVSKIGVSYRVLSYSMDNAEYPVNFGSVVRISFYIPEEYPLGDYAIAITKAYLSSGSNGKIPVGDQQTSLSILPKYIEVESVQLSSSDIVLRVGHSQMVTATVHPFDATDKTVIWGSSDPAIATVDASGAITAVALGQTTVKATASNGVSASLTVTVEATPAEGITLDKTLVTLKVGETNHLTATVTPADATDKTVTWASSDPSVATVDNNGNITAVTVGTAIITAACGGNTATCEVTVNPIEVESITLSKTDVTLRVGQSASVAATVSPSNATYQSLTWTSANPAIATVDASGAITAVALGQTTVKATASNGVSASLTVTVEATPAEGITLDKTLVTLKVGETNHLTATVTPADATDKTVTWASSDPSVATVDNNGNITAISVGTATIIAICGTMEASCVVTVTKVAQEIIWEQTYDEVFEGDVLTLTATATSGLNVNYEIVIGADKAMLSGDALTISEAGEIQIKACQPGNDMYEAAQPITKMINAQSGITRVTADGLRMHVEGSELVVEGNTEIAIYKPDGTMIYRGNDSRIPLRKNCVYIIRHAGGAVKIALQN